MTAAKGHADSKPLPSQLLNLYCWTGGSGIHYFGTQMGNCRPVSGKERPAHFTIINHSRKKDKTPA